MGRPTELVQTPFGELESFAGEPITEQLRRYGAHQRSDLAAARSLLRRGDLVLDVGAHVGTLALPFAQAVGPSGRVYAFEGSRPTFVVLRANASRAAEGRVLPVRTMVSDCHGVLGLVEVGDDSGLTFLTDPGAPGDDVPTTTLDRWIAAERPGAAVAFMKVDVEGMELRVLRGAARIVERDRPVLMLELSASQLKRAGNTRHELGRWLTARGYRLYVNVHRRQAVRDEHRLARIPDLRMLRLGGGRFALCELFAVHSSSSRLPRGALPVPATLALLAATRARRYLTSSASRSRRTG
jgi:FkbM family methyltransferase